MNTLVPTDCYAIVNAAIREMYGSETTLQAIDTTTFVSSGEHMLRTGYTNTLNALSTVMGRTIVGVRPYRGAFEIIAKTPMEWGGIERKISFYSGKFEPSENFNTNITADQIEDGKTIDHYKIQKTYPLEMNFCGLKLIQKHYTTFRKQLKTAFQSESEFSKFYGAMMTQIANDIAMQYEAENKLQVLNMIGATMNVGKDRQKVDIRESFCDKYGYDKDSSAYGLQSIMADKDLRRDFYAHFVERLEGDMALMSQYNELFHIYPARNDDNGDALTLLRHTPADMRRLILYMPFMRSAETNVLPEIFHDNYLKIENYEGVEYWQNPNVPAGIEVTPNQLNPVSGQSANGSKYASGDDIVVGLLFDRDALGTNLMLEDVITTPVNAAGDYFNTYYHWGFQFKQDQTENAIVYYVSAGNRPLKPSTVTPESGSTVLFGTPVSDLQADLALSSAVKLSEDVIATLPEAFPYSQLDFLEYDRVYGGHITGELKYRETGQIVTDWGDGYFMGLKFAVPEGATSVKVGMDPSVSSGLVEILGDPDMNGLFKVATNSTETSAEDQVAAKIFVVESSNAGEKILQFWDLTGLTFTGEII